jgi:anaerobic ribonucleoside-triphosphate reductase activating protein
MTTASLRVGRIEHDVTVLGPGVRSVVWVAGCGLGCQGCITPELWDSAGGEQISAEALADELAQRAVDGITWSGGEPFEQAAAIAAICCHIRARRPAISLMAYSGFKRAVLQRRRDAGCVELLAALDLLVDGRYVRARHAPLRWRGSSNQTIHDLSGRHADDLAAPDAPAGMHRHLTSDGELRFTGVPPVPDFRDRLAAALDLVPGAAGTRAPGAAGATAGRPS